VEEQAPEAEEGRDSLPPTAFGNAMRADRPCTDPSQDQFGYVPTARVIARTIQNAPAPHGLVLHVDGAWGSGKSSMLALVQHVLAATTAAGEKPVQTIWFNPWWFSDHEHLVQQFLAVFRTKLPHENELLMTAGAMIAQYSDALSNVVATGAASVGVPLPSVVRKGIAACFRRLVPPKKDVPALKEEIAAKLVEAQQRFVVFIDDVDRLTPTEINQVFRVIKAVADFPNVVYVLAFDREVVATALHAALAIDGSAYLEKIVQVPFVLPTLRPDKLRDLLIETVRQSAPNVRFDAGGDMYEANVLAAMGDMVRRPRDLVRLANAFAPTYAGLRDDVQAVDVAALELLRVVEPRVYRAIRNEEEHFIGVLIGRDEIPGNAREWLEALWSDGLTQARRAAVWQLLERVFPRIEAIRTRRTFGGVEMQRWETNGRICSERGYTTYFRQQRPDDELTPRDLKDILDMTDAQALGTAWCAFAADRRSDGGNKAIDLLAQLRLIDVNTHFARAFLETLLNFGDVVIEQGRVGEPIEWLIYSAVGKCVLALGSEPGDFLVDLVAGGRALYTVVLVARHIIESADRSSSHYNVQFSNVTTESMDNIRLAALAKIDHAVREGTLLHVPKLPVVLETWQAWEPLAPIVWVGKQLMVDGDLLALVRSFISFSTVQALHDTFASHVPRFNMARFVAVLPNDVDLVLIEARLRAIESGTAGLSDEQRQTIALFRDAARSLERE
jgi:predicted KAP-like P-loop ATPase